MANIDGLSAGGVLNGTSGADVIRALTGSDTVLAGAGDDVIVDDGGTNNSISGGAGNDEITFLDLLGSTTIYRSYRTTTIIDAGDGNDLVTIDSIRKGSLSVSLGAGDDVLLIGTSLGWTLDTATVSLGAGTDQVRFGSVMGDWLRMQIGFAPIVITDFAAGAGGDVLNITDLLSGYYTNPTPLTVFPDANPFASRHVLLVQQGADTIVRLDYDGNGPGMGEAYTRDIIRLTGVTANQIVAANLGGWAPNGSDPVAATVSGTAGGDRLYAMAGGGVLDGAGGNDTLTSGTGNETLLGGAGIDLLDGGEGDDRLDGGDGGDVFRDSGGNDTIIGGAGDDEITLVRRPISSVAASRTDMVSIDAGDGNDRVSYTVERFQGGETKSVDTILTANLGAGDDYFYLDNARATTVLTLAAGRDRVEFGAQFKYLLADKAPLIITDFAAGADGDQLDLMLMLTRSNGWDRSANPFATGHLRLEQQGADTLIRWDYDGLNGDDALITLVLLRNVSASSLTAYNFMGYAPGGSAAVSDVFPGTADADSHIGGAGADQLGGAGGADWLSGNFGNDLIDGGAGSDTIEGGFGNDTLLGGTGDDVITDTGDGSDSISGSGGDDRIVVRHAYTFGPETISVSGGVGADTLEFAISESSGKAAALVADMGEGDDRIIFFSLPSGGATLTSGAGMDVVVLDTSLASQSKNPITITDFQTGDAGDVLDWYAYMEQYSRSLPFLNILPDDGTEPYNPFFTGQARLIQSGADTLLQMSNGVGWDIYNTIVTFKNTSVAAFTQHNLGIDFAPDAAPSTNGDDSFAGSSGRDVVRGGGGNDSIAGGNGDDALYGEAESDTIDGGAGNDVIDGGGGADRIDAGSGDDFLTVDRVDAVLAGAGNDRAYLGLSPFLNFQNSGLPLGSLAMGDGNDLVAVRDAYVGYEAGGYSIDLGAGDDRIVTDGAFGTLTLGAGMDRVEIVAGVYAFTLTITDFQTGDSGDVIDLGRPYNAAFNPFAAGAVKLQQSGNDVLLTYNREAAIGIGLSGRVEMRFKDTSVSQFTAHNFDGYDPAGVWTPMTSINTSLTISVGTTVNVRNPVAEGPTTAAAYSYASDNGKAQFVNHGVVDISVTAPFPTSIVAGLIIDDFHMITDQSLFLNAVDGIFRIESVAGSTIGFYARSLSIGFRNEGLFEISGAGQAIGALGGYDFTRPTKILNMATGTISVFGETDAYGVYLGLRGSLDNRGTIIVDGAQFAVGVYLPGAAGQQFDNSGTITVTTAPTSRYASIAVATESALQNSGQTNSFVNSGTIVADVAFYSIDVSPTGASETLINSGLIDGMVILDAGKDAVINSGEMAGRTRLGDGADRYDGIAGFHHGSIEGGDDNDTLIGGDGWDTLFGDAQDDVIAGGGGDDYLEGGQGNDLLDGGIGFDMVSYFGSPLAINADLATGIIRTSQDTDIVRNFEVLVASRGNDTLYGSARDEGFAGFRGNDRIDGRGGDDVILGGLGNDTLTGGAGNDIFVFEAGDGQDEITDFSAGDAIEIYGYTAYQAMQQQGADVRITLSPTDSILVRNTSLFAFNGVNLFFTGSPTGFVIPDIADETFFPTENVVIDANTVFDLIDTLPLNIRYSMIQSTAIALEAPLNVPGLGVWNAGTVRFHTLESAPYSTVIASSIANGYGGRDHWVVNQAGGVLSVTAEAAKAVVVQHIGGVWNHGVMSATSLSGDASAVFGLQSNIYGPVAGTFVNTGTITVDAAGVGRGVDQGNNSASVPLMVNSGQITVHGKLASAGIENWMLGNTPAGPPAIVNSGSITVTDETALRDSAGLRLDIGSSGKVWNSGTITADYAIRFDRLASYSPVSDYKPNVYNSGTLNGAVDLTGYDDLLINTGSIDGDVDLQGGDDFYDGRRGQLSGRLNGYDGNDTLLAGAGSQDIFGDAGNDVLSGGAGADTLTGGAGNDIFRFGAGFGQDVIADFASGDFIDVADYPAYQSIVQQDADVLITFAAGDTLLVRGADVQALTAGAIRFGAAAIAESVIPAAPAAASAPAAPTPAIVALDTDLLPIIGDGAAQLLTGSAGNNVLWGQGGNDTLDGGAGNDTLNGGAGRDLFRFGVGNQGADVIADFSIASDRFDLDGRTFTGAADTGRGSTLLSYAGGSIEVEGIVSASLAQWNGLIGILHVAPPPIMGANNRIVIAPGQSAGAVFGSYDVFGRNDTHELIKIFDGTSVALQGDFARGGDMVMFTAHAEDFSARLSGSLLILVNTVEGIEARIPVGSVGLTIQFEDATGQFTDSRILRFDGTNVMLGQEVMDYTDNVLDAFGTAWNPL